MNIVYDTKIKSLLCPRCNGPAHWENKNLQCEWELCQYIYIMFPEDESVNIFQKEFNFE